MSSGRNRTNNDNVIKTDLLLNNQDAKKTTSKPFSDKKIINISNKFQNEDVLLYLESIALQNNGLALIKNHKALIRNDHTILTGKVKILSGGSAGMIPLHSGFVGPGMLTASVFGEVNSSPTFMTVVKTLQVLGNKHIPGVLVIVINSLAERLTFRLACQQAALEGIETMCVTVGEDCSGVGVSKVIGRKGMCGILFLQKIAGAMAEDNMWKKTITYYVLTSLSGGSLGTVSTGISENSSLVDSRFKKEDKSLEMNPISHAVREALYYLCHPDAPYSLHVVKGDKVAIIVNNFGRLSDFQMAIVTLEVCNQLMAMEIDLEKVYSGRFLTSNNEKSFSISMLKVNERLLKWLDFPVNVLCWPNNVSTVLTHNETTSSVILPEENSQHIFDKRNLGPKFSLRETEQVVKLIKTIIMTIYDLEEQLNKFDDNHDYGSALKTFMTSIEIAMDQRVLTIVSPYGLLNHLAELSATSMGGVLGAVFSVVLSSAAQSFVGSSSQVSICWCMWLDAATLARDALCAYTNVEVGDSPIFDVLNSFVESFGTSTEKSFSDALTSALRWTEVTAHTHPEGVADPGAYTLAIVLRTMLQELHTYLQEGSVPQHQNQEVLST